MANLDSVINRNFVTVAPQASVSEVLSLMAGQTEKLLARFALVIENNTVVGLFSERELLPLIAASKNCQEILVAEAMNTAFVTLSLFGHEDIFSALSLLQQHRLNCLPVKDNQGELLGIVTLEEISQLIPTEIRFRQAFLTAPVAISISSSQEDSFGEVNASFLKLLGYQRQEVIGFSAEELGIWFDNKQYQNMQSQLHSCGFIENLETQLRTKSGEIREVSLCVETIEFAGETCFISSFNDITKRKQALNDLQEAKDRLRAIIDTVPGFVSWMDAQGHYLGVNCHLAQTLNLNPDDFVGQELGFLRNSPEFVQFMHNFLQTKEQTISEVVKAEVGDDTRSYVIAAQKYNHNRAVVSVGIDITKRKQAEAELRGQKEFLHSIVNTNPNLIFVKDWEGRFTLANQALAEVYGTTVDDLIGKTDADFNGDAQEVAGFIEADREVISSLKAKFIPEEIVTNSQGEKVYLQTIKRPLFSPHGQVNQVICVATDITQRKKAEEALQESYEVLEIRVEERTRALRQSLEKLQAETEAKQALTKELAKSEEKFRRVFQDAPIGMALYDFEGKFVQVNPSFCSLVGYTPEELEQFTFLIINHPEDVAEETPYLAKFQSREINNYQLEKRYINKSGETIWVKQTCGYIGDSNNQWRYGLAMVENITKRKQAEEKLRATTSRLTALISNLQFGVLFKDRDGKVILTNQLFCQLFNISHAPQLLAGEDFAGFSQEHQHLFQNPQTFLKNYQKITKTKQVVTNEELSLKDGRTLERDYVPIFIDDNYEGHLWMYRDITERKRAEGELHQALAKERELVELKSRFISMASHEFRTPLSTILSSAELLEHYHHKWSQERQLTHYYRIQTSVQQITELLNDILIIGKAEAEKLDFNPEIVDLVGFCQEIVEELQLNHLHKYKIDFTNQWPEEHPYLDKKLLRHILTNLLSNAIKYSPEYSTIKFSLASLGDLIALQVQDAGIGIPPADQVHLFESFHRGNNVGNIPGTGLGLAIVKRCVEAYGGEIKFVSEVGKGTTFTTLLPRSYY
ncbi:MAG: PAS domain S-box protein [Spirulinaceae cyanobacterium]